MAVICAVRGALRALRRAARARVPPAAGALGDEGAPPLLAVSRGDLLL